MLTHPLAERLRGLGMAAMADAFIQMQSSTAATDLTREDWLGLLLDREVTARDNTSGLADGCARRDCARTLWSKTPTSARRAVWTEPCSIDSPAATGSVTASTWWRETIPGVADFRHPRSYPAADTPRKPEA